jgi:hypothetical protein
LSLQFSIRWLGQNVIRFREISTIPTRFVLV